MNITKEKMGPATTHPQCNVTQSMLEVIESKAKHSSFFQSIRRYLFKHGYLTSGQLVVVEKVYNEVKFSKYLKQDTPNINYREYDSIQPKTINNPVSKPTTTPKITQYNIISNTLWLPVLERLRCAADTGLKYPKIRIGEFVIAYRISREAAQTEYLWVECEAGNLCKYTPSTDKCKLVSKVLSGPEEKKLMETLAELLSNLDESIVAYGRETGNCACCGRELTNPESVALGIGPICASKFGVAGFGVRELDL